MTANRRILERLLGEVERFESGEIGLADLQGAILGHGRAAELGQRWIDLVDQIEGELEVARYTIPREHVATAVKPHLDRLKREATDAMDTEFGG